ncbi:MAG: S1C family serine protease, partial [Verrucomicrobiota bacterium]|nr:S1C family serine protease [Verrucomicrobiota bacterium]
MSRRFRSRDSLQRLAIALSCTLLAAPLLPAQEPSVAEAIAQEVRALFDKCQSAVVRIEAVDTHGHLSGSGFFIDPNGTLYTSYTIGGETREIVVCQGSRKFPARRLVADRRGGVALLKVEEATPFLALGKSRSLTTGSAVITIGYPLDLPLTPAFGTIGGFDIKYLGRYFATTHIRANVPVQRGQGGAPLLNMRGEVVGVLISSLDQGSALFALPIEAAEKVRDHFVRFGELRPGWMGVEVADILQPREGSTAAISNLVKAGPGAAAGLRKGDVVLQMGEMKVQS